MSYCAAVARSGTTSNCSSSHTKLIYGVQSRYSPGAYHWIIIQDLSRPAQELRGAIHLPAAGSGLVERQNLTLRMKVARFYRLTLAFSRKLAHLKGAVALYFWSYNFCLIHGSLRMTPAMAAGITDRIGKLNDLVS